jgi:thiol-disulfide isomerase/thioredoxin
MRSARRGLSGIFTGARTIRGIGFYGGLAAALLLPCAAHAQQGSPAAKLAAPTDPKAQKTFALALEWQKQGQKALARDSFLKANKQDGGHCSECLAHAFAMAKDLNDYRNMEVVLRDWLLLADNDTQRADLHLRLGRVLQNEGVAEKKDKYFSESCDELKAALALDPTLAIAHFGMGVSLAHLHQDDDARAEFETFLSQDKENLYAHPRAERFVERIDLARATMAPAFSITTLDGQQLAMDSLAGKVVLIDFWATWCGPCREALPRVREIAHKFQNEPFVVLSVSLDDDEGKWKDFVGKNGMTWPQYRDGGHNGTVAGLFNVHMIPATFTIDADGVLEDQHVGDADIEGKLKKLIARAVQVAHENSVSPPAAKDAPGN